MAQPPRRIPVAGSANEPFAAPGELAIPMSGKKTDWARLAIDAAKAGDFQNAVDLFITAISHDRRNAGLRYNLAIALERNGEIDDAAVSLTDALRLKPGMSEAAHRLSRVLAKYEIDEPARLDTNGLMNAMAVPDVGNEPLGAMAIRILKIGGPLHDALQAGREDGWDATADALLTKRTAPLLRDAIFLRAIATHTNCDTDTERLLIALRRVVLNLPPERFHDKTVLAFALALARQCLTNEHVFVVEPEERAKAEHIAAAARIVPKPSLVDIHALAVSLMYAPFDTLASSDIDRTSLQSMKPKALRDFVLPLTLRHHVEHEIAQDVPTAGTLTDATSQSVAAQYEERPYPRWTTFRRPRDGALLKTLERFFSPGRLAFMAQPFDVLIAGCGTGRQALESAIGFGPNARLTAIDLSRRSLAYAVQEARSRKITNVEFRQADLLDDTACAGPFDVIECVGVLHHLEKPLEGLAALERRLKPGGLMQIALYSAVSREELSELRNEPGYPGMQCSEDEARAYRAALRDRSEDETGGELTVSQDFWSLSGFRDLVLHVSEQQFTLPEIAAALEDCNLTFRGFTLHPQYLDEFREAFPTETLPGSLDTWWKWEQENPRLFDGMYNFWVEKPLDALDG